MQIEKSIRFSCTIDPTDVDHPVGVEIWVDGQKLLDLDKVTNTVCVDRHIIDLHPQHEIKFVMKNKIPCYTKLNSNNEIIKDSCLIITDVIVDGFELDQRLTEGAIYQHDNNGTGALVNETFYQILGCNGNVTMKFCTPIYEWLEQTYTVFVP